jgi:hypothetical protein
MKDYNHCLKYSEILLCIDLYGELRGSEFFEAIFNFFKKFEVCASVLQGRTIYRGDPSPTWRISVNCNFDEYSLTSLKK